MSDDSELLGRYVEQNSEQAFAELVNRHLGLVYHAALRQTHGNAHRAQDVAQTVFVDLARKAKSLRHRPVLAGWLYTSARYAAAKLARSEQRRQAREEGAHLMNELSSDSSSSADWNRVRGVIDDALHALSERDREAVLLRFFEGKPFAEIGAQLAVSEDAARVRVDRALDKLRTLLSRRGVTSTSIVLATLLSNEAMASAPPGLAVKITGTALAGAAATAGGVTAAGTFLGLSQVQFALAVGVALGGGGFVVHQQQQGIALRGEIVELREQQDQLVNLRRQDEQRPVANPLPLTPRIQNPPTELTALRTELASLKDKKEDAEAYQAEVAARKKRMQDAVVNAPPEEAPYAPILRPSQLDERPTPLSMVEPELTPELREEGGSATVEFIVDATGTPRNLKIINTSNPAFGRSAMAAVTKWKFRPGVVDGKPASTRLTVPFRMSPDVPGKALAKTETALVQPPYALTTVGPEFGPELSAEAKTRGCNAIVKLLVDSAGSPRDLVVTDTSSPAFAHSALAAISKWKFKPRVNDGKPVSTALTIAFWMPHEKSRAAKAEASVTTQQLPESEYAMDADYRVTAVIDDTGQPRGLKIASKLSAAIGRSAEPAESKTTEPAP